MKIDIVKNPVIINLMESINTYHQEKNIRVFEFENIEEGVIEKTGEYRNLGNASNDQILTIPYSVVRPWIELLEEFKTLHLPMYGSSPELKEREKQFLQILGSSHLFISAIIVSGKVIGFVCMDDSIRQDEKYEIPISIAAFLSFKIVENHYQDKKQYFVDYLESLDFPTGAFNRNSYMKVMMSKDKVLLHNIGIIHIDFNEIRKLNAQHGFEYGDMILQKTAKILIEHFASFEAQVYRISGDEFLIMCFDIGKQKFNNVYKKLKRKLLAEKDVSVAMGYAWKEQTKELFGLILEAE